MVVILVLAALPTNVAPYAALIGTGFVIGVAGHVIRSRTLILTGILIIGAVSVILAFVVGKLS